MARKKRKTTRRKKRKSTKRKRKSTFRKGTGRVKRVRFKGHTRWCAMKKLKNGKVKMKGCFKSRSAALAALRKR